MMCLLTVQFPDIAATEVAVVELTHPKLQVMWKREEFLVEVQSCLDKDSLLSFKIIP